MNWFNPDEAMRTGTYTSGTSGSGKTVLNFWLAERLMRYGAVVYRLIQCKLPSPSKWHRKLANSQL